MAQNLQAYKYLMYRDKGYINIKWFHSKRGKYLCNEGIMHALGVAWTQYT